MPPSNVGVPPGPQYPTTVKAYAQLVMKAWVNLQSSQLGDLTSPLVYEQLLEIPQPINMDWAFHRCDSYAASSSCMFINDDGDEKTLSISHELLGKPHAAIQTATDYTQYPADGIGYVKEFVAAWQNGNTNRMLKLSKQSVVNQVGNAPVNPTYPRPTCCGGGLLQVKVHWTGVNARFDVGTTLLGGPHAILDYDHQLVLVNP